MEIIEDRLSEGIICISCFFNAIFNFLAVSEIRCQSRSKVREFCAEGNGGVVWTNNRILNDWNTWIRWEMNDFRFGYFGGISCVHSHSKFEEMADDFVGA